MAERPDDIHQTLERLHEQLESGATLDAETRRELTEAVEEIRAALAAQEPPRAEGLRGRLEALGLRFEGSHPSLAEAVGRVIHALDGLGI